MKLVNGYDGVLRRCDGNRWFCEARTQAILGKDSQATTGGTDLDNSNGNRWKPKQMDEEREKPWHCAVCKAELTHLCGTHRPTVPVVLDMLWDDMAAALDVWPNSYRVRTHEDVYLDGLKAKLAEQAAARESKQPWNTMTRHAPGGAKGGSFMTLSLNRPVLEHG